MSTAHTLPSLPMITMTLPNGQQVLCGERKRFPGCLCPQLQLQVHPAVEALILRFGLDAQCAQQLRQLPLQLQASAALAALIPAIVTPSCFQAVAAELPVHEARNPSAFVMATCLSHARLSQVMLSTQNASIWWKSREGTYRTWM